MLAKLLIMVVVVAILAAVLLVAMVLNDRNRRKVEKQTAQKAIQTDYKPEDLAWLYSQGLKPEDIQRSAEQRRLIT